MINPTDDPPPRRRGRPRAFDAEAAVGAAAHTFWTHGYEGTSIADLTAAMGISAQSLYSAFGSKEKLHGRCLDWYRTAIGGAATAALDEPDVVAALTDFLTATADQFTAPTTPPGCLIASAELTVSDDYRSVAKELTDRRLQRLATIRARLDRGVADGQIADDVDVDTVARFVATTVQGMSVQAHDGASRAELRQVAGLAATTVSAAIG